MTRVVDPAEATNNFDAESTAMQRLDDELAEPTDSFVIVEVAMPMNGGFNVGNFRRYRIDRELARFIEHERRAFMERHHPVRALQNLWNNREMGYA